MSHNAFREKHPRRRSAVPLTFGDDICEYANKNRLTKSQAKSVAKANAKSTGLKVDAYKCPSCNGWHVGWKRSYS